MTLKPQNYVICRISQGHSCTKFEHFGIICFWVMLQTNKQINKQTNVQTNNRQTANPDIGLPVKWPLKWLLDVDRSVCHFFCSDLRVECYDFNLNGRQVMFCWSHDLISWVTFRGEHYVFCWCVLLALGSFPYPLRGVNTSPNFRTTPPASYLDNPPGP